MLASTKTSSAFPSTFTLISITIAAVLALTACSVRYGPRIPGFQPGYEEEQLGKDTYHVQIGEAWPKDWQHLEKFALYRAAEITKANGKEHFAVLNSSSQITAYAMPTVSHGTATTNVVGQTAYTNFQSVSSGGGSIHGGWYYLDFRIIDKNDAESYKHVISADSVIEQLHNFIDRRR